MTLESRIPRQGPDTRLSSFLRRGGSVNGALAETEAQVREHPGSFAFRWQLFQWLCVVGDWPRALKQVQVATQLAPDFAQTAHVYRDLIRAEVFRGEVFAGQRTPGSLLPAPAWVAKLHTALAENNTGDCSAADISRDLALSQAPASAGAHDGVRFAWITDTDTRLGPTCEIVTAGRYAWPPFAQMRKIELGKTSGLLDLLWRPATVTLADGVVSHGFLPVRYPSSEQGSDGIRLARETSWAEAGETGVIGIGQKTWMTDAGDVAMLDVTTLTLDAEHG
ncbi:type VI secretion system accessory protein TagJ [Cupriavidus sp. MP-37]|uniref:type VI secretion system accessory protein TagJ n=1 Tax=Cupriavidus sp. MP-37 TaxID=2884455 RepID=UPI001D0B8065|nr:type VI secretion system accessory protein TagJ [Cupriavidus sp. MP-37]UDM49827.1 ImpE protein superfamily protein [Cupriavidus sp. MP-37]